MGVESALAPSTVASYRAMWATFRAFAESHGLGMDGPAMLLFLADLAEKGVSWSGGYESNVCF